MTSNKIVTMNGRKVKVLHRPWVGDRRNIGGVDIAIPYKWQERPTARLSTGYSKHRPQKANGVIIGRHSLFADLFIFPFSKKDIRIGKRSHNHIEKGSVSPRVIK